MPKLVQRKGYKAAVGTFSEQLAEIMPTIQRSILLSMQMKDQQETRQDELADQRIALQRLIKSLPPEARVAFPDDVLKRAFDPLEAWKMKNRGRGLLNKDKNPPPEMSVQQIKSMLGETGAEKTERLTAEQNLAQAELQTKRGKISLEQEEMQLAAEKQPGLAGYIARASKPGGGGLASALAQYNAETYPAMADKWAKMQTGVSPENKAQVQTRIMESLRQEMGTPINADTIKIADVLSRMETGDTEAINDLKGLPMNLKTLAMKRYDLDMSQFNDLRKRHLEDMARSKSEAALQLTTELSIPLDQSQSIIDSLWEGKTPEGLSKQFLDVALARVQTSKAMQAQKDLQNLTSNQSGIKELQDFVNSMATMKRARLGRLEPEQEKLYDESVKELARRLSTNFGFEYSTDNKDNEGMVSTILKGILDIPGLTVGVGADALKELQHAAEKGEPGGTYGVRMPAIPGVPTTPTGPMAPVSRKRGSASYKLSRSPEEQKFLSEAAGALNLAASQANLSPDAANKLREMIMLVKDIEEVLRPYSDLLNATINNSLTR